jgi:hypothetical protein
LPLRDFQVTRPRLTSASALSFTPFLPPSHRQRRVLILPSMRRRSSVDTSRFKTPAHYHVVVYRAAEKQGAPSGRLAIQMAQGLSRNIRTFRGDLETGCGDRRTRRWTAPRSSSKYLFPTMSTCDLFPTVSTRECLSRASLVRVLYSRLSPQASSCRWSRACLAYPPKSTCEVGRLHPAILVTFVAGQRGATSRVRR